ncbi:MAG: TetR family transcriptional regulator C-terminal domain-containing protein, partial [Chlorobiales bacterium]|nr:TetR family transcriptional regulator C-terminal domain-containing protein [Chlorobiales bacterium]
FYNYFESKEQFTVEVIRAYNDSLMKQFDRYVEESPQDELGTIKSMYHHVLDRSEERGCLKGCLLGDLAAEIGGQSRSCEEALRQAFRAWQNRMVRLIKKGQDSGSIRNDLSAEQLAEIFLNHWEGALLRMKVDRETANARQTLDSMLDVLFKN